MNRLGYYLALVDPGGAASMCPPTGGQRSWFPQLPGNLLLQHSFLLYRALPIKMYIWEKFLDSWTSVVFSDGRVYGAIRLGMLLDSKKGDRASAINCPQCV